MILAYFGLRIYFRQKEYEIVRQRYLEQSLDIVAGELEEITAVFLHNWARSLELVKELRDGPDNFDRSHLAQGFLEFKGSRLNYAAHHRLKLLANSKIFWDCYQLALSRHMGMNTVAAKEIPHVLSEYVGGRLPGSEVSEIVEKAFQVLKSMPSVSDKYAVLREAIQIVSWELERSSLSFAQVEEFGTRPTIRDLVRRLEEQYSSEFRPEAQD